jgi:hypothetical protein
MMRVAALALVLLFLGPGTRALAVAGEGKGDSAQKGGKKRAPSDAQIKQILIEESIAAYSGNCPCPYNTARNGSRCGRRSAYDRAGGEAPLCYAKDVSAQMVQEYRAAHVEE